MNLCSFGAAIIVLATPSIVIGDELPSGSDGGCPVTLGTDKLLGPDSTNLYGSEALAVALPADGRWPVTEPYARIAVKLFWRSAGFRPGMEQNLKVEIQNLNGGLNDAVVKHVTSANSVPDDLQNAHFNDEWQNGWLMLTGIDFPSPGCWEITGGYFGQTLTFVVETVDDSQRRLKPE